MSCAGFGASARATSVKVPSGIHLFLCEIQRDWPFPHIWMQEERQSCIGGMALDVVLGMSRYGANRQSIWSNAGGFSLVEALTSVAIIGIVSVLAIPNLMALNARVQSDVFAKEVASELRWARQWAISKRDRVRLVFDQDRQAIVTQVGIARVPHHQLSYQQKGLEIDEPSAGPDVVFHPSGRSATATTIQFRNRQGQAHTITVSLTGRVSIR